ncbi:MAG: hypothetical protein NUW37_05735 [Planctomycetes bacterium]|nr:hypothetical protein [Planctomycetota bacterium]
MKALTPIFLFLSFALTGCFSGEVLHWYSLEEYPEQPVENIQVLTALEWTNYQKANPEVVATWIAVVKANDEDDLREIAAMIGAHFIVDYNPYPYVVKREGTIFTELLYARTLEFQQRYDVRGVAVVFSSPPPAPEVELSEYEMATEEISEDLERDLERRDRSPSNRLNREIPGLPENAELP